MRGARKTGPVGTENTRGVLRRNKSEAPGGHARHITAIIARRVACRQCQTQHALLRTPPSRAATMANCDARTRHSASRPLPCPRQAT
eukprot:7343033-Alexandrium_andersonii.AAC.1